MTRDDIILMAREAGMQGMLTDVVTTVDELARFAALVAAAERERIIAANAPEIERINAHIEGTRNRMIADGWRQCAQGQKTTQFCGMAEQARLEEREACARVCEDDPLRAWDWLGEIRPGGHYAAAIRAQAADRLARHGIQLPDEDEEYGNPSF